MAKKDNNGLNWYMKPNHGRLFLSSSKQLVVGIENVPASNNKKAHVVHIPLTEQQLALFNEYEKLQYLEQR